MDGGIDTRGWRVTLRCWGTSRAFFSEGRRRRDKGEPMEGYQPYPARTTRTVIEAERKVKSTKDGERIGTSLTNLMPRGAEE